MTKRTYSAGRSVCLLLTSLGLFAAFGADSAEQLREAARGLVTAGSYSWKTTIQEGQFPTRTLNGKYSDRTAVVELPGREGAIILVIQQRNRVVQTQEGWKTLAELQQEATDQPARRFFVRMVQSVLPPHLEVMRLVRAAETVSSEGEVYEGKLSTQGAQDIILLRPRGPRGQAVEAEGLQFQVENARGGFKVWVKDGKVVKYTYDLHGTLRFGARDFELNRTTTVEISDIGNTVVNIPEGAKAKLSQ